MTVTLEIKNVQDVVIIEQLAQRLGWTFKTKPARPSVDEIEQMIIKKALLDAKAIDRGELKTRPLEELLAELQSESTADNYENAMAA